MPLLKRLKGLVGDHGARNSRKSTGEQNGGSDVCAILPVPPTTTQIGLRAATDVRPQPPKESTSLNAEQTPSGQEPVTPLTISASLLAATNKTSQSSLNLLEPNGDEVQQDEPKLHSAPEATTGGQESLECGENGSCTSAPHEQASSDAVESLWDRAYAALRTEDPGLVENYEKVLSRELSMTVSNSNTSEGSPQVLAKECLDDTENKIGNANLLERRERLDRIIRAGRQRMDEKKIKYRIAGYEFVLQDQIAQAAKLVQWAKALIDEAVKASPEASMAWAGICLSLPLFTQSSVVEQANKAGFSYVTARMRYYVALEPLLYSKNQNSTVSIPENLKEAFEKVIIDLYQHILEFLFRSVLRFFRRRLRNLGRDLIQSEDWDGMLLKVKELETTLDGDFNKIHNAVLERQLKELSENAKASFESMTQLLSITERHLQVSKDILQEIAELRKDSKCNIPMVSSALYNSAEDQHILPCQQGTMISIREQITAWANDVTGETLFWVHGPAGIGKSTISRSIARSLAETSLLGASYFFRKGGKDGRRNSANFFFPTVASQLIATIPDFERSLRESLEKPGNTEVETKALGEQFKILLQTPLSQVLADTSQCMVNRVIVIDALDECDEGEDTHMLCYLLSQLQELRTVRLRVFLTSRSTQPIVRAFKTLASEHIAYSTLSVLDFSEESKANISTFLKTRFAAIKTHNEIKKDPWPDPKDLDRLTNLATSPSPLFIYAATLCRSIDDGTGRKNPVKQLARWLKDCDVNTSQLNQVYVPILNDLFGFNENGISSDALDSEDKSQLLQVLGAIVLLANMLSVQALASLLDIDEFSVNHWLRNLHAVLNIPNDPEAPIEILHKSFSDFLLGQEGTGTANFRVNAVETHTMLASRCILRMENGLSEDICRIGEPGKLRDETDKPIIARYIPPDLEYACLYWVYHLQHSGRCILDKDEVYTFLHVHFLHWLEALGWIGKTSEGVIAISFLESLILSNENPNLYNFVHDAKRFAHSNRYVVDEAPLQIYCSSLIFAPEESVVRKLFEGCIPSWIRTKPRVRKNWDAALQTLEGHNDEVRAVAFSPDGKQLASASKDHTIRIWNAATGASLKTLKGHSGCVSAVVFSPDSKQLGSASHDKTVRLWDTVTSAVLYTFEGHSEYISSIAFSPDGKVVVSASGDGTARLWDTVIGTTLQTLKGHSHSLTAVAFSPDGQQLASGSHDRTVKLWDPATGAMLQTLRGHSYWIEGVAFSHDGKQIASASSDKTVKLWDATTGAILQTLKGHTDWVMAITFSPDNKQLASASNEKTVRLWDATTGATLQILKGHTRCVTAVAFSPDGKMLASASEDNTVRLWETTALTALQPLVGHDNGINAITFSPSGRQLVSASYDQTVRLWETTTGTELNMLEGHTDYPNPIVFSPNGKILASVSKDNTVRLLETTTGAVLQTLEGHTKYIRAITFSPSGRKLASASNDQIVQLWDTAMGTTLQRLEGHTNWVRAIAFSADEKQLVSASDDNTVRLWDLTTGTALKILIGHRNWVHVVSFSPNNEQVVSASYDQQILLWDTATGAALKTLTSHNRIVTATSFSPDSKQLVSTSQDKTMRLWDTATGSQLQILESERPVSALTFSIDGSYIQTNRGSIRIHPSMSSTVPSQSTPATYVFIEDQWITRDGKNILWLPKSYRSDRTAAYGNTLAIGCPSGQVIVLKIGK